MTLKEAKKLTFRLFDIYGFTPHVRIISNEIYAVEVLIDENIYLIQKSTY